MKSVPDTALLLRLVLVSLLLISCGESPDINALIDMCSDFCDMKVDCDKNGMIDEQYRQDCSVLCGDEIFNDSDLNLSQNLINCSTRYKDCSTFNRCLAGGGSLTDDEYGGIDE